MIPTLRSHFKITSIFLPSYVTIKKITMQKVEIWKVKELGLILQNLSELLKKSTHHEWANVFHHYHTETQNILLSSEFNLDHLRRLVQNIKNCFHGLSSLRNLMIQGETPGEDDGLRQDFERGKIRLLKVLEEIEKRTIEYVH